MEVDCNIGGGVDGTRGADLDVLEQQVVEAESLGFDGVWSTEVGRDPFLPLVVAARTSSRLRVGTAVTVAFARSPMTVASSAYDLQSFSRGRFHLGLGTQVRAHVVRRYSMPWSEPVPRLREYVAALRAIWSAWQDDERLDFRGDFYQHTLMTPMFSPPRHEWGAPPVLIAAVGPRMTALAGEVADGVILHSFTTERFVRERSLPLLASDGGSRAFSINLPGLVATGESDEQVSAAAEKVRAQLAFYGATPAYREVLEHQGWGGLHEELHQLSQRGDWATMTTLVDDAMLSEFAVVGSPTDVGREIARRFASLVDRFTVSTPYPLSVGVRRELVEAARQQRAPVAR
ncbi:MAG TPA: TIGR03617 family F420-dependent LLM class oxidoreductase [Nocardioidaceae bacterium]|nr:TIGR03617 family F420-dependent LLM class oxidoreductase [Nocardioidaceae bacterium]